MVVFLKNYEFHKNSIKSYSKRFIIGNNEVYNAVFIYIILSYIIITYFDLLQFIIIFFIHE